MHALLRFAAMPTAALGILGGMGATLTPAKPYCDVASKWVASHVNELPTTYAQLSSYTNTFN